MRDFRIWQIKIEDIIPDGTVVDSGDYVATLDRTELVNKIKDQELDLERLKTQYTKTKLDTTLDFLFFQSIFQVDQIVPGSPQSWILRWI